jgi:mannose-6-phosphate isomerase-like protein (cupin superfamily)
MSDTTVNPLTGYSLTFLEASEELFRMSEIGRPGAPAPALHIHPFQEERFEVTRGSVAFVMGSRQVVCGPGEGVAVPAGVPHTFHNAGEGEFEMFGEYRPGLPEKSRRFHEVYFALARAGMTNAKGMPSLWQIAVEMPGVSDHVRLASPPWPIQRVFLALVRPIARLMGYRPFELAPVETSPVPVPSQSSG